MLTRREGKKGFRARARDTFKGLTIDTKMDHDYHAVENPNVAVVGSSDRNPAMHRSRENKDFQGKTEPKQKGLIVDTKLARDVQNVSSNADNRLFRKATNTDVPRLSEAMMNRNWRKPQSSEESPSDMIEPPWSAPPEKSKFADQVKIKHQREDEHEVVDYDRGLERVAYRCRRPEDVKPELVPFTRSESVSADLCLSAPATKMEFSEAEVGTEERAAKYDPSIFQPSVKSVVRLDDMAPTQRAGYDKILQWDEQHAGLERGKRWGLSGSSSVTAVSLVDGSSDWESVEFPYAEIRAISGGKKFEIELNGVEEIIRKQLSALVEPQSAGLPPEYLRKLYEERREERRRAMALAESTVGACDRRDDTQSKQKASGKEGTDNPHFNDLLGKLNKLCAPRIRAFTVTDKDEAYIPSQVNKIQDAAEVEVELQRSPSGDSGISGLSPGVRKRASTLNPNAVEFRCTTQEKSSSVAHESDSSRALVVKKASEPTEPTDPIRQLETRVAELEAQIARQESEKARLQHQRPAKGGKTSHTPYGAKSHGFVPPAGGVLHPAMNGGVPSPVGYPPPHPLLPGFAMSAGGIYPNPVPVPGQNGVNFHFNGMPAGFAAPCNIPPAMTPFAGRGAVAPPKPASGTSLWVKNMFGPKPVSKPDRPFRPGDGVQAVRQQEYEEYLEHLRATDPNYALNCKQRQARRADRQRTGQKKLLC
ncbi:hypothetical protein F5Y14DRAFT_198498 [Nemania sp. NC0429]|nr:hypothetical protein F5Y14DRAFT_198498 [Nemania sp. NC0429]